MYMYKMYKASFVIFSLFYFFNIAILLLASGVDPMLLIIVCLYIFMWRFYVHVVSDKKLSALFTLIFYLLCFKYITGGEIGNITQSWITIVVYSFFTLPFPLISLFIIVKKIRQTGWVLITGE